MTLFIFIERQRDAGPSHGARFRVKVAAQPGAKPLLMSTMNCQSVARAKKEAEILFGALDWRDADGDVRSSAILEIRWTA